MRDQFRSRRTAGALALVVLLGCLLIASTAFADVVTRTEGESIAPSAFSGTWMQYTGEPLLSNLWGIYSHTANDTLTFPFTGTGIDWIAAIAPTCGHADVWVDSETPQTVNLYIPTPAEYQETVWSRTGLPNGPHTLHILVAGDGNVNVDALDIHTPDPVPPVSTPASSTWGLALLVVVGVAAVGVAARRKRVTI